MTTGTKTDTWNPDPYSQFIDLRTRPLHDLLAAIPDSFQPQTVYDLGCGPGNSTAALKNRWPHARIMGMDTSNLMLEKAKKTYPDLDFTQGDIAQFKLEKKADGLFANASLQWLDHHDRLIPQLLKSLKKGGVLGIQMPNNFHAPTHQTTVLILKKNPAWQCLLKKLRYGLLTTPFYRLDYYYGLLINTGVVSVNLWETTYFQEMNHHQAIFEWVSTTGLRPVLSEMDEKNKALFAQAYLEAITQAYPVQKNKKILMPFRRLFICAFT